MATTYTATLAVCCRKQHECVGCGCVYEYRLHRRSTGTGDSPATAEQNAEQLAATALQNTVKPHACPFCGMLQPDMVAKVRRRRYAASMSVGLLVLVCAWLLGQSHAITIAQSAQLGLGGTLLSGLGALSGVLFHPNRDMTSQQLASSDKVQSGVLQLIQAGSSSTSVDVAGRPCGSHWFGLLLIVAAIIATAVPLLLPSVNGWAINDTYPAVIGPGDTTRVYLDQQVESLKGLWNGRVLLIVQNHADFEQRPDMRVASKASRWGRTIAGRGLRNESTRLWAEVSFPSDSSLSGKALELRVELYVDYPREQDGLFDVVSGRFAHHETLLLSDPDSGRRYYELWKAGQLAAMLLLVMAGSLLLWQSQALKAQAKPATVQISA